MKEIDKNIPILYSVKWIDFALQVAILRNTKKQWDLDSEVRFELITAYNDGMEINKNDGFIMKEMEIYNKPHLYTYLKDNNPEIIVEQPTSQKRLGRIKKI